MTRENPLIKLLEAGHREPAGNPEENELYNKDRVYDHLHKNIPIKMPQYSDEDIAHWVRMLLRSDMAFERIVTTARERILCLVREKEELLKEIETLKDTA